MNYNIDNYLKNNYKGGVSICSTPDWGTEIKCSQDVSLIEYLAPILTASGKKYTIYMYEDMNLKFNATNWGEYCDSYAIGVWASDEYFLKSITDAICEYYCGTIRAFSSVARNKTFVKEIKDLAKLCCRCDIYTNEVEPIAFKLVSSAKRSLLRYDAKETSAFRKMCGLSEQIQPINPNNSKMPLFVKYNIFEDEMADIYCV